MGSICVDTTFYVAFGFLSQEEEDEYRWALEQLRDVLQDGKQPGVMATARELALTNSIRKVFRQHFRLFACGM